MAVTSVAESSATAGLAPASNLARTIGSIASAAAVVGLVAAASTTTDDLANRLLTPLVPAAIALALVLVGAMAIGPYLDGDPSDLAARWRRSTRRWLLRIVPLYWLVTVLGYLVAPATSDVGPSEAFSAAASGTTQVPLRDLVSTVTFTQPFTGEPLVGPVAHLWPVATALLFVLTVPLALARLCGGRRGPIAVAALALAVGGLAMRVAVGALRPDDANVLTWLPTNLDALALGIALAALWPTITQARLRSSSAAGLAAFAAAVVLGAATLLDPVVDATVALGLRGAAFQVAALVAAMAAIIAASSARSEPATVARVAAWVGPRAYGFYLLAPLVLARWVSAPASDGGVPLPSRHPGQFGQVAFVPTLLWTGAIAAALAAAAWVVVQRPWLRYDDRPMGWFVGGMWTISLLSFASRIWAFATVTNRDPGNGDPFYYHAQANMIADGVGFGEPIQWITEGRFVASAIHPPLFTLWLTPASLVGARGFLAHKSLAALAGVLLVVVAGLLARRLAGDRAGLLAAAGIACYPGLFIIDGTLWPEALYTAFVGLALLFAYQWRDQPTWRGSALVGGAIGLAVLTRGEALLLLPLLCAPLVLAVRKTTPAWWKHGLLMGAVAGGLLAPWTIRNLVQFEETVPVSTNSDEVLYYANCEDVYSGPLIGYWSFNCQERARQERLAQGLPADPPGDESQRAAGWGDIGKEYALDHRDRWPAVAVARVTRVWDLQHSENTARALQLEGRPYDWSQKGLWVYRLTLIPGLAGLWLLRRRGTVVWPLVAMLAMVTATAVAVYGHVRFRTVGDLVLVIGAAITIDAIVARLRHEPTAAAGRGTP